MPMQNHVHMHGIWQTPTLATAHCFTLFQAAFGLPDSLFKGLEGSVIEMKPTTLASKDTAVSLKAKS